ncbi:AaceriAFR079Cp [[Ashbya] aceris (nom. inval.)]|nr:AaceriAFR079Cp [[Ashbya] aceris (nom. inval.)]
MHPGTGDLLEDIIEYAKQVSYYVENHADIVPQQNTPPNIGYDWSWKAEPHPAALKNPQANQEGNCQFARCSSVPSLKGQTDTMWPRKSWEYLQKYPENDLCIITSHDGTKRVFSIENFGLSLHPVSFSRSELAAFRRSGALSEVLFQQWKLWEGRLTRYARTAALPSIIKWNGMEYSWQDGAYSATGLADHYKSYYAQYCKYYSRLGYCTNKPCRFVHDRRNRGLCRSASAGGSCSTGKQCPLLHEPNEYIAEDCTDFHAGSCSHTHGVEARFNRQPAHLLQHAGICRRLHRKPPPAAAHVCRPFAYTSFCFRGLHCPFLHLKLCPDFYSTGTCFLQACQLHHKLPEPYYRPESLAALETGMYLLPPWAQLAASPLPSVWYGLRSLQQSLNEAGAALAPATSTPVSLQASDASERSEAYSADISTDYSSLDDPDINSDVEYNDEDFVRI